jgi:predicted Fe-Mo cluster-binding NifX family protein
MMKLMIPVNPDGTTDARFGRAHWVAVAEVADGAITSWQVHEVSWDVLHDEGSHGSHHARVMTFLNDEQIEAVVSAEMGAGMARMLHSAKLPILPSRPGDAQAALLAAVADPDQAPWRARNIIALG